MRNLAQLIYNHNPFYLLSAGCVLYGLHATFNDFKDPVADVWILAGCLAAYTTLLAATAWLIVRLGKVWDDARTILLIVILLLIAISIGFDHVWIVDPEAATQVMGIGLLFAVVMSECVLRSLKIRLPMAYRIPYYALLALFYIAPAITTLAKWDTLGISDRWPPMLFPLLAALIYLTLLPAIHLTKSVVRDNGTPWAWPWFPWSIFVFVAIGVCGRSYLLTVAFQEDLAMESTFGPYYLIPFAASILILLFEISTVENCNTLRRICLLGPIALMLMSLRWSTGQMFETHYQSVIETAGSPVWMTLLLCTSIYAYQWLRGQHASEFALLLTVAMLSFVNPESNRLFAWQAFNPLPLTAICAYLILAGFAKKRSWCVLAASMLTGIFLSVQEGEASAAARFFLSLHINLLAALYVGLTFRDLLAGWLGRLNPLIFLACATVIAVAGICDVVPIDLTFPYCIAMGALGYGLSRWTGRYLWRLSSIGSGFSACVVLAAALLRGSSVELTDHAFLAMSIGIGSFLAGIGISSLKGGATPILRRWQAKQWKQLVEDWRHITA